MIHAAPGAVRQHVTGARALRHDQPAGDLDTLVDFEAEQLSGFRSHGVHLGGLFPGHGTVWLRL